MLQTKANKTKLCLRLGLKRIFRIFKELISKEKEVVTGL